MAPVELVAVGTYAEASGELLTVVVDHFEDDSLTLAESTKDASIERAGTQVDVSAVVARNHSESGLGVIDLYDALQRSSSTAITLQVSGYAFSTLPAFRHEVHTRIRRELLPCRTRTR